MKAIIGRSAIIASALLLGLIVFSARPSIAETLLSQLQQQKQEPAQDQTKGPGAAVGSFESTAAAPAKVVSSTLTGTVEEPKGGLVPAVNYIATAYSLRGRTASGRMVSRGLIAADPRVLPLGSRVRLEHPGYSGEYIVADTGGAIRGRRIDIWTPSTSEARRFGRRTVKLTILSYPAKRSRRTSKA
jgi:3D (Asp-Asp-Asp) domain-containing protein